MEPVILRRSLLPAQQRVAREDPESGFGNYYGGLQEPKEGSLKGSVFKGSIRVTTGATLRVW